MAKPLRIDDGSPIEASETTPAESTAKVRRAMKNTLDVLSIAGPDPQARRAAVAKSGDDSECGLSAHFRSAAGSPKKIRRCAASLQEAIAITQLAGTDVSAKIAAIDYLAQAPRHTQPRSPQEACQRCGPPVAAAAKKALAGIEGFFVGSRSGTLSWTELRLDSFGRSSWLGDHVRTDGRHQHGAWRDHRRWRLHDLPGSEHLRSGSVSLVFWTRI